MATNVKVRAASMFVDGRKIGHFEGTSYNYKSGDEPQLGDPGYAGHSEGADMTSLSAEGFVPLSGTAYDFYLAMQEKRDLEIALSPIAGKTHQIVMRLTEVDIKSTHKNGTQMGTFKFEGGAPTIV